jgi:hypothetical protein
MRHVGVSARGFREGFESSVASRSEAYPVKPDSPNLDFLRSVAVMSVTHVPKAVGLPSPCSLGRFGVILFFVLSSLVLMASLERMERSGVYDRKTLSLALLAGWPSPRILYRGDGRKVRTGFPIAPRQQIP